jgi:hypothetical protein
MLPIPKVNTVYVTNTSSCRDILSCYIVETMLPIPKVNTVYVTNTSSCRDIPSCYIVEESMSLHDDVFVTYTVFTFGIGNIV